MTRQMFELKPDDLRAVIGGAVYYSATNRLSMMPTPATPGRPPSSPVGFPASASRRPGAAA